MTIKCNFWFDWLQKWFRFCLQLAVWFMKMIYNFWEIWLLTFSYESRWLQFVRNGISIKAFILFMSILYFSCTVLLLLPTGDMSKDASSASFGGIAGGDSPSQSEDISAASFDEGSEFQMKGSPVKESPASLNLLGIYVNIISAIHIQQNIFVLILRTFFFKFMVVFLDYLPWWRLCYLPFLMSVYKKLLFIFFMSEYLLLLFLNI